MGSDKSKHKSKKSKHKSDKRRKRSRSPDSDADVEKQVRRLEKSHKQAQGVPHHAAIDDEVFNAYGDSNLDQKFFWKAKVTKDVKAKKLEAPAASRERDRQEELERVRTKRAENEAEHAARQDDIGDLERRRLAADAIAEAAQEEFFAVQQGVRRAAARLGDGRARVIDDLIRMLWLQGSFPCDADRDPAAALDGLRSNELGDVREEVEVFKALDVADEVHGAYWHAVHTLLLAKLEEADEREGTSTREGGAAVHASVDADVESIFTGQSHAELLELEAQVESELSSGGCTDPDFWLAVQSRLGVAKARTRLREIYRAKVAASLDDLGEGRGNAPASIAAPPSRVADAAAAALAAQAAARDDGDGEGVRAASPEPGSESGSDDEAGGAGAEWLALSDGRFSPPPMSATLVSGQEIVHEAEDRETLTLLRRQVRAERENAAKRGGAARTAGPSGSRGTEVDAESATAERRALAAMGPNDGNEVAFSGEVPLESQEYWWHAKYEPRKPKFFNRVHTGYDWNKYNRAHYDADNPPPKVVQGYKFNLFFPDLIDKGTAPTYRQVPDPECRDGSTALVVFSAGAPYEDVAFRIVNKDWEYGSKLGFKNVFERDVLQLYFSFKRNPYRR